MAMKLTEVPYEELISYLSAIQLEIDRRNMLKNLEDSISDYGEYLVESTGNPDAN